MARSRKALVEVVDEMRCRAAQSISDQIDLIYAPLVPYDAFRGAFRVAKMLQRPLVLDLHDPWAFDEMMVYPSRAHRRQCKASDVEVPVSSDGIVMNTPESSARCFTPSPS